MPRNIPPQSILQRHLQTILSQTTNNLDVGTSAFHDNPRKRNFAQLDHEHEHEPEEDAHKFEGRLLGVEDDLIAAVLLKPQEASLSQVYRDSDTQVEIFKGRLLGVEDGLIDAIVSESYPGHEINQRDPEPANPLLWYSHPEYGLQEDQSLPARKEVNDVLTLSAQQGLKASAGSLGFHAPTSYPSHPHPGLSNHTRRSIDSEDGETRCTHAPCPWRSIELENATTRCDIPSMPSIDEISPTRSESDLPEVTDAPTESDDIFMDSMMLERPDDDPSRGTWDLSNWWTLEFTMSDLLLQREPGDGLR